MLATTTTTETIIKLFFFSSCSCAKNRLVVVTAKRKLRYLKPKEVSHTHSIWLTYFDATKKKSIQLNWMQCTDGVFAANKSEFVQ